jgi:hypothetical protein
MYDAMEQLEVKPEKEPENVEYSHHREANNFEEYH